MSSLSWIDADELSDRLRGLDGRRPSAGPTEAEAADTVRPRPPLPAPAPPSELGSTLPPRGAPPRGPAPRSPSTPGSQARVAAWSGQPPPPSTLPDSGSPPPQTALPAEVLDSAPSLPPPSALPGSAPPPQETAHPAEVLDSALGRSAPSALSGSEPPTTPPGPPASARAAPGRPVAGGEATAASGPPPGSPAAPPRPADPKAALQSSLQAQVDAPPPVYPPELGLDARLERFRAWMRACGLDHFFVADAEGLPLLLQGSRESEAVRAIAFERALRPLRGLLGGALPGALGLQLGDGRGVQTVWVQTPEGRVAVGMSTARPVSWARCAAVQAAISGVFAQEDDHA